MKRHTRTHIRHQYEHHAKRAVYKMLLDPEHHDEYKPFYKW